MNITVKVDEVALDSVVGEIVGWDDEGEQVVTGDRTLADVVAEQIVAKAVKDDRYPHLREQALEIRKEIIREKLTPIIEEALSGGFQRTNGYGEPVGKPVTMREVIAEQVKEIVSKPASSYDRDKGSLLQQTVRKEVQEALAAEIKDAVKTAREQVASEIGNQVAAAVQSGLKAR
jgi:hypothetical protein